MSQQRRFSAALVALQDWHRDSVKARDYNSPATSASKPGARVLMGQTYPGTGGWLRRWSAARDEHEREVAVCDIELELARLTRRPRVESYRDHWGKTRFRLVKEEA